MCAYINAFSKCIFLVVSFFLIKGNVEFDGRGLNEKSNCQRGKNALY